MSLFVLDTDMLSLFYRGDPFVVRNINARPTTELAISIITVDEQLTGWYNLSRRARQPNEIAQAFTNLGDAVVRLSKWQILPYRVAELKALRLNFGLMDLRIAAITLENQATIVTRNRRDFERIPSLVVEDWTI